MKINYMQMESRIMQTCLLDNMIFKWDSQIGKGPESGYMKDVVEAKRRHLFFKKSDAETSFLLYGDIRHYKYHR